MPSTRPELEAWIHEHLGIARDQHARLLNAIEGVFVHQQHLCEASKEEAIRSLMAGFRDRIAGLQVQLSAKEASLASVARYFETLVEGLTERTRRDPKTNLVTLEWFMQQVESLLEFEQRARCCALGIVDIAGFKSYNDSLGHPLGDRLIAQVARLLGQHIRSGDVLAKDTDPNRNGDVHARLGGDEFCFLLPSLGGPAEAYLVSDRFRLAVCRYDWTCVDPRLLNRPVRVDVGVVCLRLGPLARRRPIARALAGALLEAADKLMYAAKRDASGSPHLSAMRVDPDGRLAADAA
jgi:GGDEF domain-containing protein